MSRGDLRTAVVVTALCVFGLGSVASAAAGGVAEQIRRGVVAYSAKQFNAAGKRFSSALGREPGSPTAALDLGTAQYRAGNFQKALSSFRRAATDRLATSRLQKLADYDQGKTLAKIGDHSRNPSAALAAYRKSVEAFHRALQIDPHFRNAAYNMEVVRRRIHRLEQKLPKRRSGNSSGKRRAGKRAGRASSPHAGNKTSGGTPRSSGTGRPVPARLQGPAAKGAHLSGRAKGSRSGARTSSAASVARRILNEENKHPRIMNIDSQQVNPRVSQNW